MHRLILIAFVILFGVNPLRAQVAGGRAYTFLHLPTSARASAMGGQFVSIRDRDASLVKDNPATLNRLMVGEFGLTFFDHVSRLKSGYSSYAWSDEKDRLWNSSILYMNYGRFDGYDQFGQSTGTFTAADYVVDVSHARRLNDYWRLGATGKVIFSSLESYRALAFAIDLGAHYRSPSGLFQFGAVMNDLGVQVVNYTEGNREKLPFQLQVAMSSKLENAPIRFFLMANNLQQWDLTQAVNNDVPALDPSAGFRDFENEFGFTNKLFRHVVLGSELVFSDNFHLNIAYNVQRAQEMKLVSGGGLSGFSFGFGMQMRKFHFSYALNNQFSGKATNTFTLSTRFKQWKKE